MADRSPWTRLLPVLALLVVALAWRQQLGFWFTDTDTLADVVVARVQAPADLWRQLTLPLTGGYGGTNANFYRPLAMLHFALQRALFGWSAAGWHAWDLGLHLLVLAVFARLARVLGAGRGEAAIFVLIAGLHPVAAEIVPAIARNIDLLLALLVGLSLLAAAQGRLLAASLLSVLALTAKEPALAAFPAVLGLGVARRGWRSLPWLLGPWVLLVPAFLLVRSAVLHGIGGYVPGDVVQLHGFLHVLRAAGLDALATSWALPLEARIGRTDLAMYGSGALALLALGGLFAAGWRRLGPVVPLSLAVWLPAELLLGVTATYTRRLLYLPSIALSLLLAALLVRGGRASRVAAALVLALLLPGTPLWRPYLDWDVGARVAQASTEGLEAQLAALAATAPGSRLWLVDRPLRFNLDPRRAKFWQRGSTLNHGMGRYSLQAWLDERFGRDALVVESLIWTNTPVDPGAADARLTDDGCLRLGPRRFRRGTGSAAADWGVERTDDGGMLLSPPPDAAGEGVLVFGRPAALVVLPASLPVSAPASRSAQGDEAEDAAKRGEELP